MQNEISFLQIFSISRDIYVKNFKNIAIAIMFVFIPFHIVIGFIPESLIPKTIDFIDTADASTLLNYVYLVLALSIVFEPLAIGAISTIVFRWLNEGRQATIPEMMDNSLMKWHKLSISSLIFTAVIITTATLILPALYFAVTFAFYGVIAAVSDKWGIKAFAESSRLVKGRWWSTAGKIMVLGATAYILELALNSIIYVIEYPFPISVIADVIIKLFVSFFYVATAVLCHCMIATKETSNEPQV